MTDDLGLNPDQLRRLRRRQGECVSYAEACHACGARTRTAFIMWIRRPPLVLSINVDPAYLDDLALKLRASGYELKEEA